jgi:hypothetical protein
MKMGYETTVSFWFVPFSFPYVISAEKLVRVIDFS